MARLVMRHLRRVLEQVDTMNKSLYEIAGGNPECEGLEVEKRVGGRIYVEGVEVEVELVDGKYSIDGIEVGPPGQELTVNDDVDERWFRWRHTKLGRIYCGKCDPKILRTVFAAGSDWEHPDYKTGIKNASISGGENERRTTLNR